MSIKATKHNTRKANAGHDLKASRKKIQARLRQQAKNFNRTPIRYTEPVFTADPGVAELPDTDTVKL